MKLLKRMTAYKEKMENGGYKDFPTNPLPGQTGVDPSKHEANLRNPSKERGKFKPKKSISKNDQRGKRVALLRKKSSKICASTIELHA